jgi:hypothetical protein
MNNYVRHALAEFRAAGWMDKDHNYSDEMQEAMCLHVLKLLDAFHGEGHSGSSAPYAVNLFKSLALFEPIVPLTGEDWEWNEVGHYGEGVGVSVYQNNRCSHVFKQEDCFDGQPYDSEGVVFWDWHKDTETGEMHKAHFTCADSRVPVTFPYTPKKTYKFRPSEEFPNEVLS